MIVNESQISDLERTLKITKYPNEVVWLDHDDQAKKVVSIQDIDGEPSPCAVFEDGKYAALYNTEMSDFALLTRLI